MSVIARRGVIAGSAATGGGGVDDPTDIANLKAWFKADAITGLSDGDPVASWVDSSTGAHAAAQATAGYRPVYKTSIVNSLPVVRFDGVDDYLTTAAYTIGTPSTTFVVCKSRGAAGHNQVIIDGASLGTNRIWRFGDFNNIELQSDLEIAFNPETAFFVICSIINGASSSLRANGGTPATGTASGVPDGVTLGARPAEDSFAKFDIAEAVVYAAALGNSDRGAIETYLMTKYAIS